MATMPPRSKLDLPPLPSHFKKESIGERLTRIRKERGFTQVQLAEKMGIIQELISRYERDRLRMHAEMVIRFSLALGVSTDELLGMDASEVTQAAKRKHDQPEELDLKLVRRLQRIAKLPGSQQRTLIKSLDMLLKGAQ